MLRSLYTASTGMVLQQKRQANVSQNLSNIDTPSYKKQEMMSKAINSVMVKNKDSNGALNTIGEIELGTEIAGMYTNYEQGILDETTGDLDFAIDGQGFFTILKGSDEKAYTRNGNFRVNANGILETQQGYALLGRNLITNKLEPIESMNKKIQINGDGIVALDGKNKYALHIVNFEDPQRLKKEGQNLYSIEDGKTIGAENYEIKQGFLEKSNVNPLEEMVKIIEITRNFESNQKVMQSIDETLGKAVNEVGRIG